MEFKKFMSLGMKTQEGVLITKYFIAIHKAKEETVLNLKKLFDAHGYDLSVISGDFIRIFTSNEKEIAEIEKVLVEVDELGLKEIFNANLKVGTFKREFLERLKFCINNNLPYLNSDNSFIKELYSKEEFDVYTVQKPVNQVINVQELAAKPEDKLSMMDIEDKQVYNEIVEKLNYLILANPTDEFLFKVKNNIAEKVIEAILRKEYKFRTIGEIISDVMFDGLDVTPIDNHLRIEDLITNSFMTEEEQKKGI